MTVYNDGSEWPDFEIIKAGAEKRIATDATVEQIVVEPIVSFDDLNRIADECWPDFRMIKEDFERRKAEEEKSTYGFKENLYF